MPGDRWVGLVALPLRLFLGLIFTAAAIEKITDPGFFNPAGATYIGKQLQGFVADGSPLSFVITPLAIPNPQLFGWLMTIGELLVGLATIFGLFTRLAAVGGLLISLTIWLTAGWNAYPFYSGSDLPYAFGWLTILLAGGGLYSLDALIARRGATASVLDLERRATLTRAGAAVGAGLAVVLAGTAIARSFAYRKDLNSSSSSDSNSPPVGVAQLAATATALPATATSLPTTPPTLPATAAQPTDTVALATDTAVPPTDAVALPTDTVALPTDTAVAPTATATNEPQAYAPTARPATSTPRPAASTAKPATNTPRPAPTNTSRPAATSTPPPPAPTNTSRPAATSTLVPAPATATRPPAPAAGGDIGPGSTPVGGPTDTPVPVAKPPAGGIVLAKIADIDPGRAIEFTEPVSGIPSYLVRASNGSFVAYNSICTHAGCQVNYRQTSKDFNCPCHDSSFQISDGKPTKGPARRPLAMVAIRVDEASGNIYYAG